MFEGVGQGAALRAGQQYDQQQVCGQPRFSADRNHGVNCNPIAAGIKVQAWFST